MTKILTGQLPFLLSQVWNPLRASKEAVLMWSIWHMWPSTNGGRRLHQHLFLNNVFIVFLILVNRSNTSFGIVSKLWGFGGGPHTLCMKFAGPGPAIATLSIGLKPYSRKESLNGMGKWAKFGTSWDELSFGLFGLHAMIKFSTTNNGMKRKLNTWFGRRLFTMP